MGVFFKELRRRNVFRVATVYIIVGWLLVQVADIAAENFSAPEWVMKMFIVFMVLGFPVALIFAWAFEMTPDGIKLEKNVDRGVSIASQTGRKIDFLIIGALVLALAVSVYINIGDDEPVVETDSAVAESASDEISIAVLPFVNMSNDPDNEYFSDGISEELLNALVKIDGLRVPSRTSSFAFKGKNQDIRIIAAALDVDHVLEGSVRKSGDTVRVTAQLIEVESDRHLWSESYDRDLEDIFAIQDEIASNIVASLSETLGAGIAVDQATVEHPTRDVDAYQAYLRARHLYQKRGNENMARAIELFKEAIDSDPGFARAYANLASAYAVLPHWTDDPEITEDRVLPLAEAAASRALALDPGIGEARSIIGVIAWANLEWADAEAALAEAMALDEQDTTPREWYAEFLSEVGRSTEAVAVAKETLAMDPAAPILNFDLAAYYFDIGDNANGAKYSDIADELGSQLDVVDVLIRYHYLETGQYEKALELWKKSRWLQIQNDENGERLALIEFVIDALKDPSKKAEAIDRLDEFVAKNPDIEYDAQQAPPLTQDVIDMYLLFGNTDPAFEALNTTPDHATREMFRNLWSPRHATLRKDPRFKQIANDYGLSDYWRSNGWPDKCRPVGDRDFECF